MTRLHIALQEGFSNDEVIIKVNGIEHAHRSAVMTKNQIGYADSVDLELPTGEVQVEVSVPTRGLEQATVVHLNEPVYLGVSVERGGGLRYQHSSEPFGYL